MSLLSKLSKPVRIATIATLSALAIPSAVVLREKSQRENNSQFKYDYLQNHGHAFTRYRSAMGLTEHDASDVFVKGPLTNGQSFEIGYIRGTTPANSHYSIAFSSQHCTPYIIARALAELKMYKDCQLKGEGLEPMYTPRGFYQNFVVQNLIAKALKPDPKWRKVVP